MIYITIKSALGLAGEKDQRRVAHGWGLWAPEMRPLWARAWDDLSHFRLGPVREAFRAWGREKRYIA